MASAREPRSGAGRVRYDDRGGREVDCSRTAWHEGDQRRLVTAADDPQSARLVCTARNAKTLWETQSSRWATPIPRRRGHPIDSSPSRLSGTPPPLSTVALTAQERAMLDANTDTQRRSLARALLMIKMCSCARQGRPICEGGCFVPGRWPRRPTAPNAWSSHRHGWLSGAVAVQPPSGTIGPFAEMEIVPTGPVVLQASVPVPVTR
jgi:hypothetical protein